MSDNNDSPGESLVRKRKPSLVQATLSFQPVKKHKVEGKRTMSHDKTSFSRATRFSTNFTANFTAKSSKVTTKKLTIKNFVPPQVNDGQLRLMWERLKQAVSDVHNTKPTSTNLESLYKDVEDLCSHSNPMDLYDQLKLEIMNHIKKWSHEFSDDKFTDKEVFLKKISDIWRDHCKQTVMIRNIFLHLERNYALQNPRIEPLWDLSAAIFRSIMMNTNGLSSKCVDNILKLIELERSGDVVDKSLLKNVLGMFRSLGIYNSHFETSFLDLTSKFYLREGQEKVNSSSAPVYLRHTERRLQEEDDRVMYYIGSSTRKKLIASVELHLITTHMETVLVKGFDQMLDEDRHTDIAMLYTLFSRVRDGDEHICVHLESYIKKRGLELVMNPEKDKLMITDLLKFKDKIDYIISNSLKYDDCFVGVRKKSFEEFINKRQNKPAELIAKFIDGKLRSGNKDQKEEELDMTLNKVMTLFRYVQGKDVFEAFYKKDLAKRLLMGKSASIDSEKSMLSKLKQECGSQFTFKLEGMFKDIDVSKNLMVSYKDKHSEEQTVDLTVNVLTTGYWPTYKPDKSILPAQLSGTLDTFKAFYLNKHSGRKLSWQHSLSHCTIKAFFGDFSDDLSVEKKMELKKELNVSFYQGLVLLLFNTKPRLSYQEISESTNIEKDELCRVLQSLACGKTRVIKKRPPGRDIDTSDEFEFNKDFRHKLCKIKINQVQMKETDEENQHTTEKVFQDRHFQIDAAIVRIMKTRKTLSHSSLIAALYDYLKFPIKTNDLKKRIESLIERDYMERSKTDKNMYHYVA